MSRTEKRKKGPGFEYWGKRPGKDTIPGRASKTATHRLERLEAKKKIKEQLDEEKD
jgi:hypothetical protein